MEYLRLKQSFELGIMVIKRNYLKSTLLCCYPEQASQHVLKLQLLLSAQADVNKPIPIFSVTNRDYKDGPEKCHLGNERTEIIGDIQ